MNHEAIRSCHVLRREDLGTVAFGGPSLQVTHDRDGRQVTLHRVLTIPGHDCLPLQDEDLVLFFPMLYEGAEVVYRPGPSGAVELMDLGDYRVDGDWPYPHYPRDFPLVRFSPVAVDAETERLLSRANETLWKDHTLPSIGDAFSQEDMDFLHSIRFPDYIQIGGSPVHDPEYPQQGCRNPACDRRELGFVCSIWSNSVDALSIWGEYGDFVQLFFYKCPACHTVLGFNRYWG